MVLINKIISLTVAFALTVAMIPSTAFATDETWSASESEGVTAMSNDAVLVEEEPYANESGEGEPLQDHNLDNSDVELSLSSDFDETAAVDENISAIDYVYFSSEVAISEKQDVVIGVYREGFKVSKAEILIKATQTGHVFKYSLSKTVDGAVLFEFDAADLGVGNYEVVDFRCLWEDGSGVKTWSRYALEEDHSASYAFDVIVVNDMGSATADDTTAYIVDERGELQAADSIGDAIEAARSQNGISAYSNSELSAYGNIAVVLDPGHGGSDSGACANGLVEKNINLKIALACRNELSQYPGITTYMTRSDDTYVTLDGRVALADSVDASVLVSFHNDSAGSSANGSSVIIPHYGEQHAIGDALGNRILAQLSSLGLNSRGTWSKLESDGTDWYAINRLSYNCGITGIIIEHAFLTNASNAAFLANDANLTRMGIADATAIAQHFGVTKMSRENAERFVTRLYTSILNRNPDPSGLEENVNALFDGHAPAQMVYSFLRSSEFAGRNLSSEETVNCIYLAMLDRAADAGGLGECADMLNVGMSVARVVFWISQSAEFSNICASSGMTSGGFYLSEPRDMNYGVTSFAHRLYADVLGREPDAGGLNDNCRALLGGLSAAGLAREFFFSNEFQAKGLSNSDQVETAYVALLGRASDDAGKRGWQKLMDAGMSIAPVLSGFVQSPEFLSLCAECGINPGYIVLTEPRDMNYGVTSFAHRLYADVLGREPDAGGLNDNCRALLGGLSAAGLAREFFLSVEFSSKQISNDEIVEIAYKAMLDREADLPGKQSWTYYLNAGMPVSLLVAGFSGSTEFMSLCLRFGMNHIPIPFDSRELEKYSAGRIMGYTGDYIIGKMVSLFNSKHKEYPAVLATKGAPSIRDFCTQLYSQATAEGVRPEVLFCQAMKETGWLQFGGSVVPEQCNFGGLGATDASVGGAWFESVEVGLLAQAQHLKLYASTNDCNVKPIVDPRWDAAVEKWGRGSAVSLQQLNGKWAYPGDGYGESILAIVESLLAI